MGYNEISILTIYRSSSNGNLNIYIDNVSKCRKDMIILNNQMMLSKKNTRLDYYRDNIFIPENIKVLEAKTIDPGFSGQLGIEFKFNKT